MLIFLTEVKAIYNEVNPMKVSDVVFARFQLGGEVPLVNLTLIPEDIRSTSLRVTFFTPLDDGEPADTIIMTAVEVEGLSLRKKK